MDSENVVGKKPFLYKFYAFYYLNTNYFTGIIRFVLFLMISLQVAHHGAGPVRHAQRPINQHIY